MTCRKNTRRAWWTCTLQGSFELPDRISGSLGKLYRIQTEFQAAWASCTEYRQNFRQLGQVVQNTDKISDSLGKLYSIQTEFQTAWASCTEYRQNFRQLGQVVQSTVRINTANQRRISNASSPSKD